jgi:hypothetical protein
MPHLDQLDAVVPAFFQVWRDWRQAEGWKLGPDDVVAKTSRFLVPSWSLLGAEGQAWFRQHAALVLWALDQQQKLDTKPTTQEPDKALHDALDSILVSLKPKRKKRKFTSKVEQRFLELDKIKDGWLDGEGKKPFNLPWVKSIVLQIEDLDPSVFPTPEGNIQLEWYIEDNSISLEINAVTKTAEYIHTDLTSMPRLVTELPLKNRKDVQDFRLFLSSSILRLKTSS